MVLQLGLDCDGQVHLGSEMYVQTCIFCSEFRIYCKIAALDINHDINSVTHQQEQFPVTWTCSDCAACYCDAPVLSSVKCWLIYILLFILVLCYIWIISFCTALSFFRVSLPPRYSNGFIFHLVYKPSANVQRPVVVISSSVRSDQHSRSSLESPHLTFRERKAAGQRRRHKQAKMKRKKMCYCHWVKKWEDVSSFLWLGDINK